MDLFTRRMICTATLLIAGWCTAQPTRESRPRLSYCGLLREGNDHLLANVDGKWLGEGDSIQSTGGRIEVEQITADHLVKLRNGVRRWVRFGESLDPEPAELPRYAPDRDPRLAQFAAGAMPGWGVS